MLYKVAGTSPPAKTLLKCLPANTDIGGKVCPDALVQARIVIRVFEPELYCHTFLVRVITT